MISIIVCSTKKTLHKVVERNIDDTIGCEYEIILIDNSDNRYSIFSAYNRGVELAKYPNLCFIHEDILFRVKNWGEVINSALNDKENGVLGVIGSQIMMDLSFGWWERVPHVGNIIQNHKQSIMRHSLKEYKTISSPILEDAVVCDGLFLAIPKSIFSRIEFDVDTYAGFHCYDIDICMQAIAAGYKVKVVNNLLIEHYSSGNVNKYFVEAMYKFYKKWKTKLPIYTSNLSLTDVEKVRDRAINKIMEEKAYLSWIDVKGIHIVISVYVNLLSIVRKGYYIACNNILHLRSKVSR